MLQLSAALTLPSPLAVPGTLATPKSALCVAPICFCRPPSFTGTMALCTALALLWLLGQLQPRLPPLRWPGWRALSSGRSWARQWQRTASQTPVASGSEPRSQLLLSLLVLGLAGGAAEQQLGATLCQLSGGSARSSWASWLSGHSARSGSLCNSTAAAAAFVLACAAACVAAHSWRLGRRLASGADTLSCSPTAWQGAWRSAQLGIELLLLALLACEWWRSFATLAAAAVGGGAPVASTAGLAQAAALAFSLLPRPLAASVAQPWVQWWRGGSSGQPSTVLLAAGYVAAEQLLMARPPAAATAHAWVTLAGRRNLAGASFQGQQQPQLSLLTAALVGLPRFGADVVLLPLLPAVHALQRWRSAALATPCLRLCASSAAVAAAQALLLLANRASLGTLQSTAPYAAAQLLLCSLAPLLLLLRSASLR